MHKTMSRIVVLLLVVCLALGNVVPVLAADDTGSAGAVTPAAETSPAATAEATAAPAATPAAETTAGTETTPTAAPTPTAETTETPATEEPTATPTAEPTATPEPAVPTAVSYPAAPMDEKDMSGKMFVAKQSVDTVYPMFKIETATAVKVGDTIYATVQVNPAASGAFTYSYLYFGTRTDLVAQLDKGGAFDVVGGVAGTVTQAYHFTLPASAAGTRVPVCILKGDLTARSPYNSSELELVVPANIPEGTGSGEDPDKKPEAAPAIPKLPDNLKEAGIKVLKAEDNAEFKMLTAAKTGMVVAGEKLLIRFETANTSFDKLYFGSKDDAFKSPYVQGTARSDGGWVFEFELPASYRGTPMPIALGKPDGGWYTTKDLVISMRTETATPARRSPMPK